jgi:hypothetical protein
MYEMFEWVMTWLRWAFNPANLVDAGLQVLAWFFEGIAFLVGAAGDPLMAAELAAFAQRVESVPVVAAWNVALYMASPIIPPMVINGCVTVLLFTWLISMSLKFTVWIKGHVWSASA